MLLSEVEDDYLLNDPDDTGDDPDLLFKITRKAKVMIMTIQLHLICELCPVEVSR